MGKAKQHKAQRREMETVAKLQEGLIEVRFCLDGEIVTREYKLSGNERKSLLIQLEDNGNYGLQSIAWQSVFYVAKRFIDAAINEAVGKIMKRHGWNPEGKYVSPADQQQSIAEAVNDVAEGMFPGSAPAISVMTQTVADHPEIAGDAVAPVEDNDVQDNRGENS